MVFKFKFVVFKQEEFYRRLAKASWNSFPGNLLRQIFSLAVVVSHKLENYIRYPWSVSRKGDAKQSEPIGSVYFWKLRNDGYAIETLRASIRAVIEKSINRWLSHRGTQSFIGIIDASSPRETFALFSSPFLESMINSKDERFAVHLIFSKPLKPMIWRFRRKYSREGKCKVRSKFSKIENSIGISINKFSRARRELNSRRYRQRDEIKNLEVPIKVLLSQFFLCRLYKIVRCFIGVREYERMKNPIVDGMC